VGNALSDLLILIFAAFATSALTALIGLGGGVVLILLMPGLIPLAAILPVHAFVQCVSNVARVGFAYRYVDWALFMPVLVGSAIGAVVGSLTADVISLQWLPAVAGIVIIAITWLPIGKIIPTGRGALFVLGFYQTGLGMVAGATGPLGAAVLGRINTQREWLVVNTGIYMTLNHGVRAVAFALLGFAFAPWWKLILGMSVASILGAWMGTRLRQLLPEGNFNQIFRWVITVLALRMIWLTANELHWGSAGVAS